MTSEEKWREAIRDATALVANYQKRIVLLQRAVLLMKEQIEAGEPWPGLEKESPCKPSV